MFARRAPEHRRSYLVDRFSASMWIAMLLILVLSMVDAFITLYLLDFDCHEVNPLMRHLLNNGVLAFVLGKYALTAAGLPLLLLFKNYFLFGTRFRVGYLIPAIVVMYVVLLIYQVHLLPAEAGGVGRGSSSSFWKTGVCGESPSAMRPTTPG
jgi:hypothetical protein